MGVTIRPGGASWAYGGFMRFRERLAEAEGIDLREMKGFGGDREWELPNGQSVTPLAPLLNHSDCDGYLAGYECASVLPRLKSIVESWGADGSWDYDTQHGRLLVEGMEHCAQHGCALVFS